MIAAAHAAPHHARSLSHARELGIAMAATAVLAAGAYGLSHVPASGANPSGATASGATTSAAASMPLVNRVAPTIAFPGYVATQRPLAVNSAAQWATSVERAPNPAGEAKRLQGLGFAAGVDEQLHGRYPLKSQAISIAEQFRSAAGARAELSRQYALATAASGGKAARFAVMGIPGAEAWQVSGPRGRAVDIDFSAGRVYYLVGASLPPTGNVAATRNEIVRAAQANYLLVNGCVAPTAAAEVYGTGQVRRSLEFPSQ